ncbi:MAG: T9SS type A sorting domain-containing protein [Ignavibacterium sp.]|nr:T9SS type A sorting domain-containing protein [Ignavibacterium sp.]
MMTGNPGKDNDWRAFWDNGTSPLIEFNGSNTFTFIPGKAFFVISKNQIVINQNVSAVQLAADNTYSIPIHNEWNLISNPFDKTIPWSSVQAANSLTQPMHHFQNGSYNSPANLEPYNGYYFFNSNGLTALKIPYSISGFLEKRDSPDKKELEIKLGSGNENKSQVTIGFSEFAEMGVDLLDIFSPPSKFCEINISIHNKKIETSYKYLKKEYRKEINKGQEFNILVENNSDRNLIMFFSGLESFIDYETYLLDINRSKSYDLKKTENIEIENNMKLKSFQLLIGTKEYISQKETNLIPNEYCLYQNYPNPFNPCTKISWKSPVGSHQVLKVFDVLGREVATLVDEYRSAGRYEVEFYPVSGIRNPASGIYFYQLRAGSFVETKKMTLLR